MTLGYYMGTYVRRVDYRGRICVTGLPPSFVEALSSGSAIKGTDGEYRFLEIRFPEIMSNGKEHKDTAYPLTVKSRGLRIPAELREYAGIGRDAAVIGTGDGIEIWNPDSLEEFFGKWRKTYEEELEAKHA